MAKQSSNKTVYLVIGGIIILAIIGFGGYKLWHHFNKSSMIQNTTTVTNSQPQPSGMQNQQTSTSESGGLPNKSDTSNQQLDQDVQNVQNGMNQLQQDQGTASQDTGSQAKDVPQQ